MDEKPNASRESEKIAVIGLGYVGLPLAIAFARDHDVVGFDISRDRVEELRKGEDRTGEVAPGVLGALPRLLLTDDPKSITHCTTYVVTVPTPVDEANRPDLTPVEAASRAVGAVLKPGDLVIYESTVYPGTTEEVCVPILETASALRLNQDFSVGYSPERINPGDPIRKLENIIKITSGSSPEAAARVDQLYRRIITAGTHPASSIRVAEAAKVIENTQRDVNIALVNELAMIFNVMDVDTHEVLAAAGTKWNFLPFRPGLVGGHCIGVDPYYLTHKATVLGYHPELILSARRINSRMGLHVAHQLMRAMANKRIHVVDSRILVLGLTFKEDCPDLRNTRVIDIVNELRAANATVDVHDPLCDPAEAIEHLGIETVPQPQSGAYDAVLLAVAHTPFRDMDERELRALCKPQSVRYDVKGVWPREWVDGRL